MQGILPEPRVGTTRCTMRTMHSSLSFAVIAALLAGCQDRATSEPAAKSTSEVTQLAEGAMAPDFRAPSTQGEFSLAAQRGKPVVVYFYPKDETQGCTVEAESFRDAWSKLQAKGVTVVGISADDLDSHRTFAAAHSLPFTLVTDPDGSIARKFQVPFTKMHARQTFLIGADGTLQKAWRDVTPTGHADAVLAEVKS